MIQFKKESDGRIAIIQYTNLEGVKEGHDTMFQIMELSDE